MKFMKRSTSLNLYDMQIELERLEYRNFPVKNKLQNALPMKRNNADGKSGSGNMNYHNFSRDGGRGLIGYFKYVNIFNIPK